MIYEEECSPVLAGAGSAGFRRSGFQYGMGRKILQPCGYRAETGNARAEFLSGAVRRQGGKSCVFTGRKGRLRPGTVGETGQGGMLHACQALSDCRMVRKTGSQGEGGGQANAGRFL